MDFFFGRTGKAGTTSVEVEVPEGKLEIVGVKRKEMEMKIAD